MMDSDYIKSTVEALVLASPEPIPSRKITQVLEEATSAQVNRAVSELNEKYSEIGSSFRIRELAGGYQIYILPEYVGFVDELFTRRRKMRMTRAALETVAIIAYRQPVTKAEIEHIRGVASDGVIHNLMEKGMITIKGRANTVGRPLQYGTTNEFLKFFGLKSIDELPKMSEIEELISAGEDQNQTELNLKDHNLALKLNIADGTYDPDKNYEDYDEDDFSGKETVKEGNSAVILSNDETTRDDDLPEDDEKIEATSGVIVDMGTTNSSD
ncbi:MAG: SMC-Scp complex subunit ScpB [candidate division Zixibacteria bacterium]|nr:SMC-Scp complex subunit ScpB [candidate division Zixibacteria bacterium]